MVEQLINFVAEHFNFEKRNDRFGNSLYRAFGNQEFFNFMARKFNMDCKVGCYAGYGVNDDLMVIITYCEGDIYYKMHSSKETYEQDKQETIEWYCKQN